MNSPGQNGNIPLAYTSIVVKYLARAIIKLRVVGVTLRTFLAVQLKDVRLADLGIVKRCSGNSKTLYHIHNLCKYKNTYPQLPLTM